MSDDGEVLTSEQMEALQTELAELEGPRSCDRGDRDGTLLR